MLAPDEQNAQASFILETSFDPEVLFLGHWMNGMYLLGKWLLDEDVGHLAHPTNLQHFLSDLFESSMARHLVIQEIEILLGTYTNLR